MRNNRTKTLEDKFCDAALNLILDEYAAESGAQLLKEYENTADVDSPASTLEEKCRKEIRSFFRKKHFKTALVRCAKTAVISIVCLGICLTMALSVDAIRIPFLNFFLERSSRYTQVSTYPAAPVESKNVFAALNMDRDSFAPDGYSLSQSDYNTSCFTALYANQKDDIASIGVYDIHGNLKVDSEDCTENTLTVNGFEAIHWKKKHEPAQSILLLIPEKGITCHLYASNLSETDFLDFVFRFAAFL